MEVKIVRITPRMAEELLQSSEGNVRYSKGKKYDIRIVNKICEDIRKNNWVYGNNSIVIDSNGHLIDGHHRLKAI